MRFIVDFDRYPTAVAVMVIEYAHGFDVPSWWVQWNSTQQWIAETYETELAA